MNVEPVKFCLHTPRESSREEEEEEEKPRKRKQFSHGTGTSFDSLCQVKRVEAPFPAHGASARASCRVGGKRKEGAFAPPPPPPPPPFQSLAPPIGN